MFLRIFQHLLPSARAWRLTISKQLREFFEGLSTPIGSDIKDFYDNIFNDIDPQKTRAIDEWDNQFGLHNTGLTDQQRRDRLDATWQALGSQDPRYIQDTLQANGFDVYVHNWWVPGSEPTVGIKSCTTPINPKLWLRDGATQVIYLNECGELLAECGEALAEAGERTATPPGYPLVNKITKTIPNVIVLCGEVDAECGEVEALAGNFTKFQDILIQYEIPLDPNKWPYFLYIGGQTFGNLAQIDPKRKDEFESLCLKICPAQHWLGILAEYV